MEFKSSMSGAGRESLGAVENDSGCESGTRSVDADVAGADGTVGRGGVWRSIG